MSDDLILEQIEIGPMQNFAYIIGCQTSREVVIIDPAWDVTSLLSKLDEKDYKLKGALVTHYHPDHIGGAFGTNNIEGIPELLAQRPVKVYAHNDEVDGVKKITGASENDMTRVYSGDKLSIGAIEIEFLHTPGHTPGSQCFRIQNTLVSGDTLFINGCGRVDLPGSNSEDMFHSIKKLSDLPDDTVLLPGHNYAHVEKATLKETKKINTYMNVKDLDTWKLFMG